jgi:hypothetical protein
MKRRVLSVMVCVMAAVNVASADSVQGIDIDFVTIGHAGNVADTLVMTDGTSGYGSVAYNYRIGKYEITNAQWDAFTTVAGAPTGYPPTAYDEDSYFPGANIPSCPTTIERLASSKAALRLLYSYFCSVSKKY